VGALEPFGVLPGSLLDISSSSDFTRGRSAVLVWPNDLYGLFEFVVHYASSIYAPRALFSARGLDSNFCSPFFSELGCFFFDRLPVVRLS
jgi:hypothetical protein